jgi:hypothetical protein
MAEVDAKRVADLGFGMELGHERGEGRVGREGVARQGLPYLGFVEEALAVEKRRQGFATFPALVPRSQRRSKQHQVAPGGCVGLADTSVQHAPEPGLGGIRADVTPA